MKVRFFFVILFLMVQAGFSQHDYAKALHLTTYFNGAQRCGDTKSWIHPEGGCHLTDGQKVGVDLTGGWHDCGDYIKFHVTGPYTALVLLYGYDNYPEAYPDDYSPAFSAPPPNGIPDILDEVKVETDYLIKAAAGGSTIHWQVGHGPDHNSFTDPITNSAEKLYGGSNIRSVYSATEGRSNAFGNSAAALALMAILYKPYDAAYAEKCVQAAVAYYTVGRKNPKGTADAADGFYGFLGGSGYADELGMGAIMLHRATGTQQYLDDAKSYAGNLGGGSFMYGDVTQLLFLELYRKTKEQSWLSKVGNAVNGKNLASCGYYHSTNWGSLRDAGNAAMLAGLYHLYAGSASAYTFAKANVDFILGSHNAFGNVKANFSFLIGYDVLGAGYPKSPHHAPAFGKSSNAWELFTKEGGNPGSVGFKYELKGGLPGGPESSCGSFHDKITNYVSSEYCSYYNAAFTGAVAYVRKKEGNLSVITNDKAISGPITQSPIFNHGFAVFRNVRPDIRRILVHDNSGRILWQTDGVPALHGGEVRIDFRKFAGGVYFANLMTAKSRQSVRIVK